MGFDMNGAWSRGVALVRENFQLLAVIAGLFVLLPTLAFYYLVPGMDVLMDPTADPEIVQAQVMSQVGPLATWGIVGSIILFIGYGAMVALMGDTRPTVGEALKSGATSVPSVVGAMLGFLVLYILAAVIVTLPIALLAGGLGLSALALLIPLLVLGVALILMARFSVTLPVIVVEKTFNPLTALKRSWDLTRPARWRVLSFWAVLGLAYVVISLLLVGLFGLVAAMMGDSDGSRLLMGLVNGVLAMLVGMLVCGLAVAIHRQLAGATEAEIAATFD